MKKFKEVKFDLNKALVKHGVTKYRLSKILGKETGVITKLCREGNNPTLSTINEIAKAINCPVSDLLLGK